MPVHDWTRVEAGIFHDFHVVWTVFLRNALNEGLLPKGYYALAEQHAGRAIADVLTLHGSPEPQGPAWSPPDTGGIAVAEAPPRVSRRHTVEPISRGPAPFACDSSRHRAPVDRARRNRLAGEQGSCPARRRPGQQGRFCTRA